MRVCAFIAASIDLVEGPGGICSNQSTGAYRKSWTARNTASERSQTQASATQPPFTETLTSSGPSRFSKVRLTYSRLISSSGTPTEYCKIQAVLDEVAVPGVKYYNRLPAPFVISPTAKGCIRHTHSPESQSFFIKTQSQTADNCHTPLLIHVFLRFPAFFVLISRALAKSTRLSLATKYSN